MPEYKVQNVIKLFKSNYLGDPTDPETEYMKEVRIAVADLLKLQTEEEMDKLRFYNSLGTGLDIKKGWDGFFEYDDKGETYRVGLDPTLNPDGDRKKYGDPNLIIIAPENFPDSKEESEDFEKETEVLAELIATGLLKEKENQKQKRYEKSSEKPLFMADKKERERIREYRP